MNPNGGTAGVGAEGIDMKSETTGPLAIRRKGWISGYGINAISPHPAIPENKRIR